MEKRKKIETKYGKIKPVKKFKYLEELVNYSGGYMQATQSIG